MLRAEHADGPHSNNDIVKVAGKWMEVALDRHGILWWSPMAISGRRGADINITTSYHRFFLGLTLALRPA